MPRKEKHFEIKRDEKSTRENRDLGKVFFIREMSAMNGARWADRAFLALAHAGVEIPKDIVQLGIIGVFLISMRAFTNTRYEELEPLLDELLGCVQFCPNNGDLAISRKLIDTDIEEIQTIYALRQEVLQLHSGFTYADVLSFLTAAASPSSNPSMPSQNTQTSPG